MPRKASTVASVCSRASAVSLGFKDRLGFTRSSSTRANSTYRHRKLPLRRRLSLIDPFYGHTVHFLIHIEVVRVVARPALRRRSVVRRLFSGTLHRCLRAFVALIVSRRRVCTYFSHTIRARPRLATLHPQDIGRRLRLQRAFAPFQVRLELDRIARLPCPFSLSTPLFRVKMANRSSVFARRARARPFVVPRPPVRVVVRARATHRFHHRSTFRPSLAPVSRARDRARIAPRAPAFVVATGAAAFRFDARVIAPRPPSAASAREVVPLRTLASMAFLSFIDRAIEIEIAVSTRTQRRSIAIAVRARARVPTDRAPDRSPRSNHAAFASSRASSSRASAPARPPRSRRHAPRCVHARYPPTDSFAPASAQIARTVSVAGSMRRSARARRRVAPRARRRRRRRRDVPSYGQTVRRSRRVPTAVDARARQRRARRSRTPRGSRDRRATIAVAATTGPRRAGADARDATRRRRGFPRIQSSSDARIRGIDAVLAR